MRNIEKIKNEIETIKDMMMYSLNDPNYFDNLNEDVIKREEHLMKMLARLQKKLIQM